MTTSRSSFEYTATGILGDHRFSMLKNDLHLRVEAVMFCSFIRITYFIIWLSIFGFIVEFFHFCLT